LDFDLNQLWRLGLKEIQLDTPPYFIAILCALCASVVDLDALYLPRGSMLHRKRTGESVCRRRGGVFWWTVWRSHAVAVCLAMIAPIEPNSAPVDDAAGPDVAVIDYGMGNLRSVVKALQKVGAAARLVNTPAEAENAAAVVFPGQGAIVDTMTNLRATGFDDFLRAWIGADQPFFGVCLGLQALFEHSEEGNTPGLGIWPGRVVRFRSAPGLRIPHMGWNTVTWTARDGQPVAPPADFYFVHSYHVEASDPAGVWGTCDYGRTFVAAAARGRCRATQFHPEKSQAVGLALYRDFVDSLSLCG